MLGAVALRGGEQVLELACGAGRVGLRAAAEVGPEGHVVCSDFADPMVEAVRRRAAGLGLENVEARVMDAESLQVDDESFDVVLCRFGYMLMPRWETALAESFRVLNRGGRLALAVWGPAERNPWLSTTLGAVMAHFAAPPPEPGTPGPFALGDDGLLDSLLAGAGFEDVVVEEIQSMREHESLDEWWSRTQAIAGPLASILSQLPDTDVAAIRQASFDAAGPYVAAAGAVEFPASVIVASARRPG